MRITFQSEDPDKFQVFLAGSSVGVWGAFYTFEA